MVFPLGNSLDADPVLLRRGVDDWQAPNRRQAAIRAQLCFMPRVMQMEDRWIEMLRPARSKRTSQDGVVPRRMAGETACPAREQSRNPKSRPSAGGPDKIRSAGSQPAHKNRRKMRV